MTMTFETLTNEVAALLEIDADGVGPDTWLLDWGLDSLRLMTLVEQLRAHGSDVTFMDLAEAPTLEGFARALGIGREAPTFSLVGPEHTVLTQSDGQRFDDVLADHLVWRPKLERHLAATGGIAVGALPFAQDARVDLRCPTSFTVEDSASAQTVPRRAPERLVDDDPVFAASVERALEAIATGALDKVVLALARDEELGPLRAQDILEALRTENGDAYVFHAALGGTRHLLGASPELLVARRGRRFVSRPLAGTAPRSRDDTEDRDRAARLERSAKDQREHRYVVEAIAAALRPLARDVSIEPPRVVATPTVWHLESRIEGELASPEVSALQLALALHPTPAVCGVPADAARRWIEDSERFDRGFFTGTLGWVDASGDGEWVVAIRCAALQDGVARLYAGAGIVAGSIARDEVREVHAKLTTVRSALRRARSHDSTQDEV